MGWFRSRKKNNTKSPDKVNSDNQPEQQGSKEKSLNEIAQGKDYKPSPQSAAINSGDKKQDKDKTAEDKHLEQLNQVKADNDEKQLRNINSQKDTPKKDHKKSLSRAYQYWVYIFKNGRRISSFGVNEEEYAGVKLLVRKEDVGGQTKVIFRELYPEPKYDLNTIKNNKKQIKDELNKYKQIQDKLEKNLFSSNPKEYNYDISDVKLKIQELELMLNSIRYGVTVEYFHDIRDDGIPVLMYDMENSGLKLRKYVKEKAIFTEASENKKIESEQARQQIDKQLKKSNERDWLRIATSFAFILLLAIGTYGVFQLLQYNEDRAFGDTKKKLDESLQQNQEWFNQVLDEIKRGYQADDEFQQEMMNDVNKILNRTTPRREGGIPTTE